MGEDWLDRVCNKATTLCPVPNDLPAEAFETTPKEEEEEEEKGVLDHVFEGVERSLSLTTAARLENADQQQNQRKEEGDATIETGSWCGSITAIDEVGEGDDADSVMEMRTAQQHNKQQQHDALDRVFENVERMTCGPSSPPSPRKPPSTPKRKEKTVSTIIKEDKYVTRADLESQGVQFRGDGETFVPRRTSPVEKPILSLSLHDVHQYHLSKGGERPRWALWLAGGILALILIITGAVLLGTGI